MLRFDYITIPAETNVQSLTFLSIKKEKIDVAPNTNFDLLVPLEGKKLAPGHYQAVVKGAWKEKRWNLHTDFEITDDESGPIE